MARLKCVINFSQEPYVLLKRSPSTPVFDERFVDYGYNKIQLVEHLRHVGYDFLVLMTSYGMDMPHRSSKLRSSFLKRVNDTDSMSSLFMQFRQELCSLSCSFARLHALLLNGGLRGCFQSTIGRERRTQRLR